MAPCCGQESSLRVSPEPSLLSGSVTDLANEIERLPIKLAGNTRLGGLACTQETEAQFGQVLMNWEIGLEKNWIKFSKKMGTLNNQLQKYCVESNSVDSSEEDFEVIVPPKMNINSLYNPVLKSQMRIPGIVECRFGNSEEAMDHL